TGAHSPRDLADVEAAADGHRRVETQLRAAGTGVRRAKLRLNASMAIGGGLVVLIVGLALVSFLWTPYGPSDIDPIARLQSASPAHPLGTDKFGRDTLTWVMYGARITLLVGVVAVGIALLIG